jgi:serine/threonine protein kinase
MMMSLHCSKPGCGGTTSASRAAAGGTACCSECGSACAPVEDCQEGGSTRALTLAAGEQSDPSFVAGAVFDRRYRLERRLGKGGMGVVHLAFDLMLGRKVALKIPHVDHALDPALVKRFQREARIAAGFDHPNLCPVYDFNQVGDVQYLTMPYIEGRPLSTLLEGGLVAPRRAAEIVATLAMALAVAHRRGVVHRDLKPANIMVSSEGKLVIMDFGIARSAHAADSLHTATGAVLGTPAYMAPEQVHGNLDAIGPCTDIYCLGVIFYQLLTGRPPFQGNAQWVCVQIANDAPTPPAELRFGLDPSLEAICLKAMAKEPSHRYRTMEEMAGALESALKQGAPSASGSSSGLGPELATLRTPPTPAPMVRQPAAGPEPCPEAEVRTSDRRRRAPFAAVLAVLALVVLGGLYAGSLNRTPVVIQTEPVRKPSSAAPSFETTSISNPAIETPRLEPFEPRLVPASAASAKPAEPPTSATPADVEPARERPAVIDPRQELAERRKALLEAYRAREPGDETSGIPSLWEEVRELQERIDPTSATIIARTRKSKADPVLTLSYKDRDETQKTLKLHAGAAELLVLPAPVTLAYGLLPVSATPTVSLTKQPAAVLPPSVGLPPPPFGMPPPPPGMPLPPPGMPLPPGLPHPIEGLHPSESSLSEHGSARSVSARRIEVTLRVRLIEFSLVGGKWQHRSLPPPVPTAR